MNPHPPFSNPGGPGIFGPHQGGPGPGPLGWTLFALELVAIAGIAWLLASMVLGRRGRRLAVAGAAPLELLHMRYARGEVSREEYLQAREDLGPAAPPAE